MIDKITQVYFKSDQDYRYGIKGLEQWDKGQKLEISGLNISDEIVEVHFSLRENQGEAKRMLATVENGIIYADIPAFVLEGPEYIYGNADTYSAYAWIYLSDEESAETIRKMEFEIKARPRPAEYVTPEELSFLEQLRVELEKLKQSTGASDEQIAEAVQAYLTKNPSDATVTTDSITKALGYKPANAETVSELQKEIANVGSPTDEQVTTAVNNYLTANLISGLAWGDVEDGEIFEVTEELIPCTAITLDATELLFTSNEAITLVATVTPTNTTDTITWESNNTSVVTVENGVVTPLENGDCTITVKCGECSASCSVNVNIEEVVTTSNTTKVSVETNNGVEYFKITNANDILSISGTEVINANTYKNDNYQVYYITAFGNELYDLTSTDFTNSLIPQEQNVTGWRNVLNSEIEGDVVGTFSASSIAFRLPIDLNGYATAREYLAGTYRHMYFAKAECNEKVINPSLITTINIKTNDDTCQYAQFGYSDLPTSNIYKGLCSLSGLTGDNANLSAEAKLAPRFAMSTTTLSCKFAPNTFEEFTLENVKQYLTDNPLIFWYV